MPSITFEPATSDQRPSTIQTISCNKISKRMRRSISALITTILYAESFTATPTFHHCGWTTTKHSVSPLHYARDDDSMVDASYQKVALEDPEWYQKYVVGVHHRFFQNETALPVVDMESSSVRPPNEIVRRYEKQRALEEKLFRLWTNEQTKDSERAVESVTDDENEESSAESPKHIDNLDEVIVDASLNKRDANETMKDPPEPIVDETDSEHSIQVESNNTSTINDKELSQVALATDETNTEPSSRAVEGDLQPPTRQKDDSSLMQPNKTSLVEADTSSVDVVRQDSLTNQSESTKDTFVSIESPSSPTTRTDYTNGTTRNETSTLPNAELSAHDQSVVYQESGEWITLSPLSDLLELGYTREDVLELDPDALTLLVKEHLPKPSSGIPARWKAAKNILQIMPSGQMKSVAQEKLLKEREESGKTGSVEKNAAYSSPGTSSRDVEMEQKLEQTEAITLETLDFNNSRGDVQVGDLARNVTMKDSSDAESAQVAIATRDIEEDKGTNQVVLTLDSSGIFSPKYPMKKFHKLGYSTDDVQSLDPDALALIARESLARPRNGIPSRWKAGDVGSVQVLSQTDAQEMLEKVKKESRNNPTNVPSGSGVSNRVESRSARGASSKQSTTTPIRRPTRLQSESDETTPFGNDDSGRRRVDRRERKIYTGRNNDSKRSRTQIDDPPDPQGFWPSIGSFRAMLRDEASMRLRLLGDDWEDVVRDESNWRLDLYKKWLWTLHNGVGTPIVESRTDRRRRLEQQNVRRKRQAMKESSQRRKRSVREERSR